MENIYEPKFVEKLFDKMSGSYTRMNYVTSFGFSERWRRQCVEELNIEPGATVVDLLTGMGECWKFILRDKHKVNNLIALDFSAEMIIKAQKNRLKYQQQIEIRKENVFGNTIRNESADYVISGFGLKTFDENQLKMLAFEVNRILKPNGEFSLVDVSVPKSKTLQALYMFYLKNIIPILGKIFLGNPETYKMLGVYTEKFKDSKKVFRIFKEQGLKVEYVEYFFGCASGIKGMKNKIKS